MKIDPANAQVAARLATPFTTYKMYDPARQQLIKAQLERIHVGARALLGRGGCCATLTETIYKRPHALACRGHFAECC